MADASEYAAWIVANADKRGTPEFETVAKAYQQARAQVPQAKQEPENPTSVKNIIGAALEPGASLLSGMVAQPVAGIAGLVSGATGGDPAETVRRVSAGMTYEPKTTGGKNAMSVISKPFEMLSDLGTAAGEKTADVTGSPALGAAITTAIGASPLLVGGSSTPSRVAGSASNRLMQSALKPSAADLRSGDAAKAIATLLAEGVNVTPGGAAKLDSRIGSVNDQISEAIANSNARVNKGAVVSRLQDLVDRVERQATPNADVAAVEKAWNEFSDHSLIPGQDMPVQLAQDIKKGTYRRLRDKYGEEGNASTEAQKGIARGLREEIATAVPEVGPLNARESALINANNVLEKRVGTAGNANPLGLSPLGGSASKIAAMLLDRSSLVKSLLARGLNPGDFSLSDAGVAGATGAQTFGDDMKARQALIQALMRAQ